MTTKTVWETERKEKRERFTKKNELSTRKKSYTDTFSPIFAFIFYLFIDAVQCSIVALPDSTNIVEMENWQTRTNDGNQPAPNRNVVVSRTFNKKIQKLFLNIYFRVFFSSSNGRKSILIEAMNIKLNLNCNGTQFIPRGPYTISTGSHDFN